MPTYQDILNKIDKTLKFSRDAQLGQITGSRGLVIGALDGVVNDNKELKQWFEDENDLLAENIKDGITIFGVTGEVVDAGEYMYPVYYIGDEAYQIDEGYLNGSGTQTKRDDDLYMDVDADSEMTWVTNTKADLTNFNRAVIRWESGGSDEAYYNRNYFVVSTDKMGNYDTYDAREEEHGVFSTQDNELDISSLSGEYYIRVHGRNRTGGTHTKSQYVYRVWLET